MTTKTTKKEDAMETFLTLKSVIDTRLARLQEASEDHFHKNPDRISWQDVGDLEHYAAQLKELTDQIFHEGEYA